MKVEEAMTAAAPPKPKTAGKELESIRIEPAENGFTVSYSCKAKKSKKDDFAYAQPEQYVFSNAKDALAFVGHAMGECSDSEGDDE